VRIVTALAGPVDVEVEAVPGRWSGPARNVVPFGEGLVADRVVLRAGAPLLPVGRGRSRHGWGCTTQLRAGERLVVTVDRLDDDRHPPLSPDAALRLVESTESAWRSWLAPISYSGAYRGAVERSALVLRSLSPWEGGPPVAAGTTSLPRRVGGERTADDRYVRWRDAATAASVLARIGLHDDAAAAEEWLRRAVEGAPLPWPSLLATGTAAPPARRELPHPGWRGSGPVVTGRDDPLDRDLYGSVAGAVSASTVLGADVGEWAGHPADLRAGAPGGRMAGPLTAAWPALAGATDHLAEHWADPDGGVWGMGGPPRRLTATRVQAWVALDRMARLARAANPLDLDALGWQQAAAGILTGLEADAAAGRGLSIDSGPGEHPDAALLRLAWAGPWPLDHPPVVATVDRILQRLGTGPVLNRYPADVDDGRPGPDSPDVLASLWAVRALAGLQRWEEAHERMARICALGEPLGLLSEAVDPLSGEMLGNRPSAGAHLALIEAALALDAGPR
jgi:GH15 family glucan-1,4-alpha-glucosidase